MVMAISAEVRLTEMESETNRDDSVASRTKVGRSRCGDPASGDRCGVFLVGLPRCHLVSAATSQEVESKKQSVHMGIMRYRYSV